LTATNDDDEEEGKGRAVVAILQGTRRWRMDDVKEKDDTHRLVATNNVESIMVTVIIVNE
jgi:hypothetical protein